MRLEPPYAGSYQTAQEIGAAREMARRRAGVLTSQQPDASVIQSFRERQNRGVLTIRQPDYSNIEDEPFRGVGEVICEAGGTKFYRGIVNVRGKLVRASFFNLLRQVQKEVVLPNLEQIAAFKSTPEGELFLRHFCAAVGAALKFRQDGGVDLIPDLKTVHPSEDRFINYSGLKLPDEQALALRRSGRVLEVDKEFGLPCKIEDCGQEFPDYLCMHPNGTRLLHIGGMYNHPHLLRPNLCFGAKLRTEIPLAVDAR